MTGIGASKRGSVIGTASAPAIGAVTGPPIGILQDRSGRDIVSELRSLSSIPGVCGVDFPIS